MHEDPTDRRIMEALGDYNLPSDVPREAIWSAIQDRRHGAASRPTLPRGVLAAAAVLVFAAGALTGRSTAGLPIGGKTEASTASIAGILDRRVSAHLSASDSLITAFRIAIRQSSVDGDLVKHARDLLSTTQLLEDAPAVTDTSLRRVLRSLDLVLTQMAQYSSARKDRREAGLIENAIDERRLEADLQAHRREAAGGAIP